MGQCVWSQNINNFVYVPNHRAADYLARANSWGLGYASADITAVYDILLGT